MSHLVNQVIDQYENASREIGLGFPGEIVSLLNTDKNLDTVFLPPEVTSDSSECLLRLLQMQPSAVALKRRRGPPEHPLN